MFEKWEGKKKLMEKEEEKMMNEGKGKYMLMKTCDQWRKKNVKERKRERQTQTDNIMNAEIKTKLKKIDQIRKRQWKKNETSQRQRVE